MVGGTGLEPVTPTVSLQILQARNPMIRFLNRVMAGHSRAIGLGTCLGTEGLGMQTLLRLALYAHGKSRPHI